MRLCRDEIRLTSRENAILKVHPSQRDASAVRREFFHSAEKYFAFAARAAYSRTLSARLRPARRGTRLAVSIPRGSL